MGRLSDRLRIAVLASALAAGASYGAVPELVGVREDGAVRYLAFKSAPERPAVWVRLGTTLGELRVAEFDARTDTAVLVGEGSRWEVSLRAARTRTVPDDVSSGLDRVGGVAENMRRLVHAAYQHLWDTGAETVATGDFVGPERPLGRIEAVAGEDYAELRFALREGGKIMVTDGHDGAGEWTGSGPISIQVRPQTPLGEIARRMRMSEEQLRGLNPEFEAGGTPGAPTVVRLR